MYDDNTDEILSRKIFTYDRNNYSSSEEFYENTPLIFSHLYGYMEINKN